MRHSLFAVACLGIAACGSSSSHSAIDPAMLLVVNDGEQAVTFGQVVSGIAPLSPRTQPAAFEKVKTSTTCRPPRPGSNARAAYVYTYGGGSNMPLHHVNFEDTPEAVEARRKLIEEFTHNPQTRPKTAMQREAMSFAAGKAVEMSRQVNVLVTETDAPVFLYLTSYDSILWNIQRAPGVTIDGIVVNSYDAGIIANGVDASRTGFMAFANSPGSKCYVSGHGRPVPVEERVTSARKLNPSIDLSSYKEEWAEEFRDDQRFFDSEVPRLVGKRPEWLLNNARGGKFEGVLVGPVPATPFQAQPVTRLQVPSHITPFWGTRKDSFKAFGLDSAT